jgi:hypothetical protein
MTPLRALCIKIISPVTLLEMDSGPWAVVGATCPVLEIIIKSGGVSWLRVLSTSGLPQLLPAAMFRLEGQTIPSGWMIRMFDGDVRIAPPTWLEDGFWEDYFNAEPEAVAKYDDELRDVLSGEWS